MIINQVQHYALSEHIHHVTALEHAYRLFHQHPPALPWVNNDARHHQFIHILRVFIAKVLTTADPKDKPIICTLGRPSFCTIFSSSSANSSIPNSGPSWSLLPKDGKSIRITGKS